jgi:hypothetical protein
MKKDLTQWRKGRQENALCRFAFAAFAPRREIILCFFVRHPPSSWINYSEWKKFFRRRRSMGQGLK